MKKKKYPEELLSPYWFKDIFSNHACSFFFEKKNDNLTWIITTEIVSELPWIEKNFPVYIKCFELIFTASQAVIRGLFFNEMII